MHYIFCPDCDAEVPADLVEYSEERDQDVCPWCGNPDLYTIGEEVEYEPVG